MKIVIKNIKENPAAILRKVGYVFQRNVGSQNQTQREEMSFVRPLARAGYPRFHMYVSVTGSDMTINFHLDQKKETYGEGTRHHGEYENEGALRTEAKRIIDVLSKISE